MGGPGAGTTKFGAYLRLASLTRSTRVSAWGYGDAGLPCGSRVLFGSHMPFGYLSDSFLINPEGTDLIVVWGSNPAETAPLRVMRPIMDAKARGARLVVIDPRFTVTAAKADEYLGIRPGTDTALALGLLHVMFRDGLQDDDFLRRHTVGPYLVRTDSGEFLRGRDAGLSDQRQYVVWDSAAGGAAGRDGAGGLTALTGAYTVAGVPCKPALQTLMDLARDYTSPKVSAITGVSEAIVEKLAAALGRSEGAAFITHMGVSRTFNGDVAVRALGSVAAVSGHVTTRFGGGHRRAVLNWQPFLKADPGRKSYERLGILQLYDAVLKEKPYPVKALWFAFINFMNQCVDSNKIAGEMFARLDFIAMADLFMTPTARYADILLPACSYLEFSDLIPHPYPYVQLQQKVIEPLYESKSDVDIAAGLAERLGYGEYFAGGQEGLIDLLLDTDDPSVAGITRAKLAQGPVLLNPGGDADAESELVFGTPSGKIELYCEGLRDFGQALPVYLQPCETPLEPGGSPYPLAYIQGHSRFRTHSMFANVPSLLRLNPEPVVEINPEDAAARRIRDDDGVFVFNDRGRTALKARVTAAVRPGVVNITEGWWADQFGEGGVNHLTHDRINPVQEFIYEPNMHMNDVAVEVVRSEEVPD